MEINDVVKTEEVVEKAEEILADVNVGKYFGIGIAIGVIGAFAGEKIVKFIRNKINDKRRKREKTEVDGIEIVADVEPFEVN